MRDRLNVLQDPKLLGNFEGVIRRLAICREDLESKLDGGEIVGKVRTRTKNLIWDVRQYHLASILGHNNGLRF